MLDVVVLYTNICSKVAGSESQNLLKVARTAKKVAVNAKICSFLPTFLNVDRFNISRGSSLFNMITLILFKKVELKTPLFSIPFIVPVQEARALKYRGDLSSSLVTSLTRTITNMADDKAERTVYVSFLF